MTKIKMRGDCDNKVVNIRVVKVGIWEWTFPFILSLFPSVSLPFGELINIHVSNEKFKVFFSLTNRFITKQM